MNTSDWTTLAATLIGGAAAILAAFGLLYTIRQYKLQVRASHKDTIRQVTSRANESLSNVRTSTSGLVSMLKEGTSIISAAASISAALGARLGAQATREDALRFLDNEMAVLSLCIEGIAASPEVSRVYAEADQLVRYSRTLEGQASILTFTSDMLRTMAQDSTSYTLFATLLSNLESAKRQIEGSESELIGVRGDTLHPFLNALSIMMQGNLSTYFYARYKDAAESIDAFVERVAALFLSFDEETLHTALRADVRSALSAPTRTGSMLGILDQLKIPNDTRAELTQSVKNIEHLISKKAASEQMETLAATRVKNNP